MCQHVFMYDIRDKNISSQINGTIEYIPNTHRVVMQNKIYCN